LHSVDCLGEDEEDVQRRELLAAALTSIGAALAAPALAAVREAHRNMKNTLDAATTSISMLNSWEETIEEYGVAFRYVPPTRLLSDVAADLVGVRQLASRRQPPDIRRRIHHIAAQLTGVGALALSDLGRVHEASAWFRAAGAVADETGDRRLRAWVLAKDATELLFNGKSPDLAMERALRAQMIGGSAPSAGLAIAHSAEARAHAALGSRRETIAALARAKEQFSKLPSQATSGSVYAYGERQLLFHEGDALTTLGASRQALLVHRSTAPLYSVTEPLEPALIRINEAKCLIREGDMATACMHTTTAFQALPAEYHGTVALIRAREVLDMIPAKFRSQRDVRALAELLKRYSHASP
jgi:tetratricopeptide (TPR) repeat protein